MELINVCSPEFRPYGRVITGYDVDGLMKAMESTPLPEDVVYVASVPELEALPIGADLSDGIYGQMEIQLGYCNGHNKKLNALEYHRDSEVNLAVTDLVLLLGRQQDIEEDFTYDTSKVKAFLVPAGTLVEVYATTLHYAPCQTEDSGFRCVVVLPRGTNTDLDHKPHVKCGEEKLITARNKWLIGHEEGGLDGGAWIGLKGENISL
ncbi:DUF4867 family protein [Lachnoclostridium pacaense]|uniref:DUF4867 family protein n=1 Tax=Enterocloster hominis (ex Hitch et al. 2024) TaxID=1917870 RepID=UPI001D11F2FD|nr:DUF4867 family protein [Lachnoclostridium pacaense]MCC2820078.1 DUF4867 family protein [Lachnoclostridium pacaense]